MTMQAPTGRTGRLRALMVEWVNGYLISGRSRRHALLRNLAQDTFAGRRANPGETD